MQAQQKLLDTILRDVSAFSSQNLQLTQYFLPYRRPLVGSFAHLVLHKVLNVGEASGGKGDLLQIADLRADTVGFGVVAEFLEEPLSQFGKILMTVIDVAVGLKSQLSVQGVHGDIPCL